MLMATEIEELPVDRARAGDAGAWDALFRRYQLPLYAYVIELVREEQTALDLVQETFINAVRHIASLRQNERFGSWLFGIAHQKCLQKWRRKSLIDPWKDEEIETVSDEGEGPDELLIKKEQEAAFMTLVATLPLPHRTALLLHYLEDFSLEEIAAITGANLGTVKSRLHYAKRSLRKLWEERL